ncbi:MAG: alpha/beta fold hydrolase [Planctomycetaceae bacterium]|nr:alpha/beta fold hydrolase [Planctomycetaceae bacterium]
MISTEHEGLIIVLPGIEGASFFNRSIVRGLHDAGLPFQVECFDWTKGFPLFLYNLRSRRLHTLKAQMLAEKIQEYREQFPERKIYLIGHSGGGALAMETLAELPDGVQVTGVMLLRAALSPWFDLRPGLKRVERAIWNLSSWGDFFFLGICTCVVGTVDGRLGPGIGMVGCRRHRLTPEESDKLIEFPYQLSFWRYRDFGGHFGCTSRLFVREVLAKLLADGTELSQ